MTGHDKPARALALSQPHADLPTESEWNILQRMAKAFAESGLYPSIKNVAQAVAIVQTGRELGVPGGVALRTVNVISGKPTTAAELMAALVYRDHGSGALRVVETTNERCVVRYKRREWSDAEAGDIVFTLDDAERAGLLEKRPDQKGKSNWEKYPRAMLRSRAISEAARTAFQDSILGLYTPEELAPERVTVTETGEVVLDESAAEPERDPEGAAAVVVDARPADPIPVVVRHEAPALERIAGEFAAAEAGADGGQPPPRALAEARSDLKEACLRVGLPAPITLREVNTLARERGLDVVGSSAGVTPAWLDRIRAALPDIPIGPLDREHMSDKANALTALRATCGALGRPPGEPRSLDALNALAREAEMGIVASWDTATAGWLEAIQRHLVAHPGTTEAPAQRHTTEAQSQRTEQSLAGWIAAAPDRATLEQLSSDVHRAHEAGAVSQGVAEALLEAVDARTAELDLYGAGAAAAAAGERGTASAQQGRAQEVDARAAG